MKIAVLDDYQGVAPDLADWNGLGGEVTFFRDTIDGPGLVERLKPFDVVCLMRERTPMHAALIRALPNLKLIVTSGPRNLSIDLAAADAQGIVVSGTEGRAPATAQLAMALILLASRGLVAEALSMRNGGWQAGLGRDLDGLTLGLIGLGKQGAQMAALARPFGMHIAAWSANLTRERCDSLDVERAESLAALLAMSDVASVHVVLSERSRGLIDAAAIAGMKRDALLVNTSRGPIVDQMAAIEALKAGAIDYLTKPIDNDRCRQVVTQAIARGRLTRENRYLRAQLRHEHGLDTIIAVSEGMRAALDLARRAASSRSTVLVSGESGTGKELVARAIHLHSDRVGQPFVAVNCKAFADGTLESELFGHVKGAFTGAVSNHVGKFQAANKGTIFLDEIGELPPQLQAHLLRVMDHGEYQRLGEPTVRVADLRIIAATNRDLQKEVAEGNFREDLYHRLNVINVHLPALRDRGDDVLLIARYLVGRYAKDFGRTDVDPAHAFDASAAKGLLRFKWPGNIRQLENHIKKALVLADGATLTARDLDLEIAVPSEDPSGTSIVNVTNADDEIVPLTEARDLWQRAYINRVLALNNGNRTKTARDLGVDPRTIFRHLEKEEKAKK